MIPDIDVRRALALKQYEGQLSFDYEADDSLLDIPLVSFASPVHVSCGYVVLNEGGETEVKGSLTFTLKGQCSRCLAESERTYTADFDVFFQENADDGETYAYTNGRIKLTEAVRDAVVFALPGAFWCSDACEIPDYD